MGRPPLKGELTSVRLDPGDKERIAELRGTYGLAKFVREAVQEKLETEEVEARAKLLAEAAGEIWGDAFQSRAERGTRDTQAGLGEGARQEFRDLARQQLLDERTRKPKDT